ncbi:MAG TPA: hypothetical protein VGN43_14090, partial [Steroidobacteraceae bacterium]|nr:hypothetical protein [Steroidobacteraceae bacterium]
MLRRLNIIAATLLAASVTAPLAADPAPLSEFTRCYSVPSEFEHAKFVVEADALSEMWVDSFGIPHFSPPDGPIEIFETLERLNFYENVRVIRSFKGKPP